MFSLCRLGRMRARSAILLAASLLAPIASTAQGADALDVPAAVAAAWQRSQALKATEANALAARETAVVAGQRPDPVLRLSLDNLPVNGPDRWSTTRDFMTMRSIGLMQALPSQRKREARARRFELEAQATGVLRQWQASELQRDTTVAWFERRAAEQRLVLLDEQLAEARLQVQAAEAAVRGGKGSPIDWVAARDALWKLEQDRLKGHAELVTARNALSRWTGLAPEQPLAEPPTALWRRETWPALETALGQHPELRALQGRVEVARAVAAVAREERDPDWGVELMLSQRGSAYSDMLSVAVSIPLTSNRGRRQDRELAASLAQADAMEAEWQEAQRSRRQQIATWQQDGLAALAQRELIDRERLPLARQRVDLALAAYRSGAAPLSAVLEARQTRLVLALERIEMELSVARPWAALEALSATKALSMNPPTRGER